jgi:hypothetical protein
MLWNGLSLTHCVVRIVKLARTSLLGDLPNRMARWDRGLDHSIVHCCGACAYPCRAAIRKTAPKPPHPIREVLKVDNSTILILGEIWAESQF